MKIEGNGKKKKTFSKDGIDITAKSDPTAFV